MLRVTPFPVLAVLAVLAASIVTGCGGTTFGGLGDDDTGSIVDLDTGSGSDTEGADTEPIDDTGSAFDGTIADSTDAGPDAAVDAVDAVDVLDTAVDGDVATDTRDAAVDADTGIDSAVDTLDSSPIDAGSDVGSDAGSDTTSADTGGPTWTNVTGKVACEGGQCDKTCCGHDFFGWGWTCTDTCIAGRTYDCDEKSDCGGKVCCTSKNVFGTIDGSGCKDSCGGDLQLCATTAECSGGKTCKAFAPPDLKVTIGACQ